MTRRLTASLIATALAATTFFPAPVQAEEPFLSVATDEELGQYIVGPEGQPVYIFDTKASGGDGLPPLESCADRCRGTWPPLYIKPTNTRDLTAEDPLKDELLEVVVEDERTIAIYDGQPLFQYAYEDQGDGPSGHARHSHGGWRMVLSPDGEPIRTGSIPTVSDY